MDAEFDQLYEKMTQTANMESNVTTTLIPGYEKIETSSFQKSVEGIALEKDIEDAVRIPITETRQPFMAKSNMTDAEKCKSQSPTNEESPSTHIGGKRNGYSVDRTLPPLEDPSIILTSPSYARKASDKFQGKYYMECIVIYP